MCRDGIFMRDYWVDIVYSICIAVTGGVMIGPLIQRGIACTGIRPQAAHYAGFLLGGGTGIVLAATLLRTPLYDVDFPLPEVTNAQIRKMMLPRPNPVNVGIPVKPKMQSLERSQSAPPLSELQSEVMIAK